MERFSIIASNLEARSHAPILRKKSETEKINDPKSENLKTEPLKMFPLNDHLF